MIVLGVDPSTVSMGYGVLRSSARGQLEYVTAGAITAPKGWPIVRRLDELARGLEEVVGEIDATEVVLCGIEAGFVKGQAGAIALGAARGVAQLVMYRRFRTEIEEYQNSTVKKAATGHGAADKGDVAHLVARRLGMNVVPGPDAGDALAVAICRAQHSDLWR